MEINGIKISVGTIRLLVNGQEVTPKITLLLLKEGVITWTHGTP